MNTTSHIITYNQQFHLNNLPALKLKQLQHESERWKRLLDFIMNENIHLKNRLSEILKDQFDEKLLAEVEDFQNTFLKEDQLIEFLRNEVAELEELFLNEKADSDTIENEIDKKLNRLTDNMITIEREFGKLQHKFNSYISQNI
jgi:chromosome segregation ATPase